MNYLGIDFGSKKIGLARGSDETKTAFPYEVIPNKNALAKIIDICQKEKIETVVIGESKNYEGNYNKIHEKAEALALDLKEKNLEVIFQSELLTTQEANRIVEADKESDARAAAIILQSYLDSQK